MASSLCLIFLEHIIKDFKKFSSSDKLEYSNVSRILNVIVYITVNGYNIYEAEEPKTHYIF